MIIGSVAGILVFVWFYNTASRSGRSPLNWAIAGFVVYCIIAFFWTFIVNPGIKDAAMHSRNTFLMYIARYAYIVVSLAGAIFFNLTVGKKKSED